MLSIATKSFFAYDTLQTERMENRNTRLEEKIFANSLIPRIEQYIEREIAEISTSTNFREYYESRLKTRIGEKRLWGAEGKVSQ